MGSSYFGEPNMGNERGGGSSSSSSRKGKKGNSDKPKQPQRGLGVAQLEKIRLHGQMGYMNPYPTNNFITNQVEDTRVQAATYSSSFATSQSSSSPSVSYGFQPNTMMGLGEYDQRANMKYGDSSHLNSTTPSRWEASNAMLEPTQQFVQPRITTRHLLNPPALVLEDFHPKKIKKHRSNLMGSSSQNSESSESQEVDLELRLSL
ncbi:protein SPEAR1-like isoform X3 [Argentina anserina]|uniref:protein SPEAR1-like isoform X3 n=1 Tax=Argentina anserina TaxID=57926 RepID=UPI0021762AB5|nr:protein SPEAR1-like isoform X3 [Potentilla anserina]